MTGITVKEYGLRFVGACLKEYVGESWPILLIFAVGILAGIVLSMTGKKKETPLEVVDAMEYEPGRYEDDPLPDSSSVTWTFLSIVLFCTLTVMNPFLVRGLIPKLGMTTVYYRFFWILPITFGAAYWLTRLVGSAPVKLLQAVLFAGICAVFAVLIPLNPGIKNLKMPTNVYKVDGAVPVLCEAIHADYEKSERWQKHKERESVSRKKDSKKWLRFKAREYPVCVFPYEIEFAVRQYDPSIRLLVNRNLRLYYEGNLSTGISYGDEDVRYMRRKKILDAMYGRDPELTSEEFAKVMKKTKTRYLVIEEHLANGSFLVSSGCRQVGVVAGYTIFSFGV